MAKEARLSVVPPPLAASIVPYHTSKRQALEVWLVGYVEKTMAAARGNMTYAAVLADMDRTNWRRIVQAAHRIANRAPKRRAR